MKDYLETKLDVMVQEVVDRCKLPEFHDSVLSLKSYDIIISLL